MTSGVSDLKIKSLLVVLPVIPEINRISFTFFIVSMPIKLSELLSSHMLQMKKDYFTKLKTI